MTSPPGKTPRQGVKPPDDEDDIYAIRAPAAPTVTETDRRIEELLRRHEKEPEPREKLPPPPATFLSGVIRFPWYLQSLGPWVFSSIGIALSLFVVVLTIWLADNGMESVAIAMRLSIGWVIILALSYVSGCFLAIIEGTAGGYDEIVDWPKGDWRDYFFSLGYPLSALVLAGLVAWGAYCVAPWQTPIVPLVAGFVAHPFFLLSAMENASVVGFVSRPILRSFVDVWWGWLVMYAISGAILVGWLVWAMDYFPEAPFFTAGVSGPILATFLFLYARLLGRLAWWRQKAAADR